MSFYRQLSRGNPHAELSEVGHRELMIAETAKTRIIQSRRHSERRIGLRAFRAFRAFRASGLGPRAWGVGLRASDTGPRIPGSRLPVTGYRSRASATSPTIDNDLAEILSSVSLGL